MPGPGLNKVTLIGNLGADPERRRTQSGTLIANLSIATSESWLDNETKERRERTEWHRVVFFGKPAEPILQYMSKGRRVYIEGRLQTRKWQDQNGQDRYTTEIVGRDIIFLDRGESGSRSDSDSFSRSDSDSFSRSETSDFSSSGDDLDADMPW